MSITEADKLLTALGKKETLAYDYGFDGGGKAYVYSVANQPIMALIPKADSDNILSIIALSKRLKTSNGLRPESQVSALLQKYPQMRINRDDMMDWEYMHDSTNGWTFVFLTDEENRVGPYDDSEQPAQPIRKEAKIDWIEIK
ncbi:hypothetical protein [Flavobacterium sp.]|uniref:hypothetical protein n=1 Tax=Flavobacterium sp. TaxID=239 RepID=UPI0039E6B73B